MEKQATSRLACPDIKCGEECAIQSVLNQEAVVIGLSPLFHQIETRVVNGLVHIPVRCTNPTVVEHTPDSSGIGWAIRHIRASSDPVKKSLGDNDWNVSLTVLPQEQFDPLNISVLSCGNDKGVRRIRRPLCIGVWSGNSVTLTREGT